MNIRDKVLLVEDERTIRSFMQAILTANGYDVLMAGTGAMANTMIASHCPDIIILDLGLPDMDGMTILRNVRKFGRTGGGLRRRFEIAGCVGYVGYARRIRAACTERQQRRQQHENG